MRDTLAPVPAHAASLPQNRWTLRARFAALGVGFALIGGGLAWGLTGNWGESHAGAAAAPTEQGQDDVGARDPTAAPTTTEPEPPPEPADVTIAAAGDS